MAARILATGRLEDDTRKRAALDAREHPRGLAGFIGNELYSEWQVLSAELRRPRRRLRPRQTLLGLGHRHPEIKERLKSMHERPNVTGHSSG